MLTIRVTMKSSASAPKPTPAEAAAQLHDDRKDKDLNVPEEDNEFDEPLQMIRSLIMLPANIKMLEDIRITTNSWLAMVKQQENVTLLQTDLQEFFEGLTKLLCTADEEKSIWTKGEVKSFDRQCKLMKAEWEKFKQIVHPIIQEHPDHEEEQTPMAVDNNEAPKKRRTSSFPN